jgi:gamma-glutamylaminecyclotransferase
MKIMVYGTLKKGRGNHSLLEDCPFLGKANTLPAFTMFSLGGFPGVVAKGNTSIRGEIYDVLDEVLHDLDRLEGHPRWYERKPITAQMENGEVVVAHMYILPNGYEKNFTVVESGIW